MQPVENVSNYPRPPLIELVSGSVEIWIAGKAIAQGQRYVRVCETFHPPSIYLHPSAFSPGTLHPSTGRPSFCEWKGVASYWDVMLRMAATAVIARGGVTPIQRRPFLSWPGGSAFIPAELMPAGWLGRLFWHSRASFMAAGSAHGSLVPLKGIPTIPS